jgi:hypothetical protein
MTAKKKAGQMPGLFCDPGVQVQPDGKLLMTQAGVIV